MTVKKVKVALLLCDTPVPAVVESYGTYLEIFTNWLKGSLTPELAKSTELVVDGFDVVNGELPDLDQFSPGGYNVLMLTGSKHDAHDSTIPFVPPLQSFVRDVAGLKHVKLIGICFGHQIIALALGGVSGRGGHGWEVGVYKNVATEVGRQIWGGDVYVQQMHRDCVSSIPAGFELLLSSERYRNHSMMKLHDGRPQILTIQGHPEFTPEIVNHIIDARAAGGVLNDQEVKEARRRAGGKDGTGGEGMGRVGQAIWNVMLT